VGCGFLLARTDTATVWSSINQLGIPNPVSEFHCFNRFMCSRAYGQVWPPHNLQGLEGMGRKDWD